MNTDDNLPVIDTTGSYVMLRSLLLDTARKSTRGRDWFVLEQAARLMCLSVHKMLAHEATRKSGDFEIQKQYAAGPFAGQHEYLSSISVNNMRLSLMDSMIFTHLGLDDGELSADLLVVYDALLEYDLISVLHMVTPLVRTSPLWKSCLKILDAMEQNDTEVYALHLSRVHDVVRKSTPNTYSLE